MRRADPAVHRVDAAFPLFEYDCGDLLPSGWIEAVTRCARSFAKYLRLDGASPTSRQRQLGSSADDLVGAVTGSVATREVPWLDTFYRHQVSSLIDGLDVGGFSPSEDHRSGLNVNVLPPGSAYEWHVDTNPLTALLFVTDHPEGSGGELVFRADPVTQPDRDRELRIHPVPGLLLIFDAREAAHAVMPVKGTERRISVPMNFYQAHQSRERPRHLDRYLYGAHT